MFPTSVRKLPCTCCRLLVERPNLFPGPCKGPAHNINPSAHRRARPHVAFPAPAMEPLVPAPAYPKLCYRFERIDDIHRWGI